MALFAKDSNDIIQESIEFLKNNTNLTATSKGSKIRALIDIIEAHLSAAYSKFDQSHAAALVYGATGVYLDYIGDLFGIKRKTGDFAAADSSAQSIKFYTSSTFGSINNGSDIVIPEGTRIWGTGPNGTNYYITDQAYTLPSNQSEAYIGIRSLLQGRSTNISAGKIINFGEIEYTDKANNSLKLINVYGIENGLDRESDANLRYRIINEKFSRISGGETALLSAALSIPGVADANIIKDNSTSGLIKIFIKSVTPRLSMDVLNKVQDAVNAVKGESSFIEVQSPTYIDLTFKISARWKPNTTSDQKEIASKNIKSIVEDYVNNLDIGEGFDYNSLASRIISGTPQITSIGKSGSFFDYIKAYKKIGNYSIIKDINGFTSIKNTEKFLLSDESNPVVVI